jgi:SAM-dependent methyltransferase
MPANMSNELQRNLTYGTETLEVISAANRFNRWMYETIKPHCKGNILEIGSGIGNISRYFAEDGAEISLSDFDDSYFPRLRKQLGNFTNVKGIYRIDFSDKELTLKFPELTGSFDTVFALNVVEHIEDHLQALHNARLLLKEGGNVVILVPAFQTLFNGFDRQLGHYRRYTEASLKDLLEMAGFDVVHTQYFNFIGALGWYFSGNILKKKMIPEGQMKLYDTLVPLWKIVDIFTNRFSGISVIQSGVKS